MPDGEPLPLERLVRSIIDRGQRGAIRLVGPPGSGKSCALQHLASCLTVPSQIRLVDDAPLADVAELTVTSHEPVLFASPTDPQFPLAAAFEIEPWGDDDLIEYLLSAHPDRVDAVMRRVRANADRAALRGSPLLWRIVLDAMAASEQITTAAAALRSFLAGALPDPIARRRISTAALRAAWGTPLCPNSASSISRDRPVKPRCAR